MLFNVFNNINSTKYISIDSIRLYGNNACNYSVAICQSTGEQQMFFRIITQFRVSPDIWWIKFDYIIPTYSRITRNTRTTPYKNIDCFYYPTQKYQIPTLTHPYQLRFRSHYTRTPESIEVICPTFMRPAILSVPTGISNVYYFMRRVYALFTHVAQFDPLSVSGNSLTVLKPPEWPPTGTCRSVLDMLCYCCNPTFLLIANNNTAEWNIPTQYYNTLSWAQGSLRHVQLWTVALWGKISKLHSSHIKLNGRYGPKTDNQNRHVAGRTIVERIYVYDHCWDVFELNHSNSPKQLNIRTAIIQIFSNVPIRHIMLTSTLWKENKV